MLRELDTRSIGILLKKLRSLSEQDRHFFQPHKFDIETLKALPTEIGNYYYLFYSGNIFAGYGILRTFGKYPVPTLGCVIWSPCRGKAYSKQLVQELVEKAQELGFTSLKLKVHQDNHTALLMYRGAGFKIIGAENNYYWMQRQVL